MAFVSSEDPKRWSWKEINGDARHCGDGKGRNPECITLLCASPSLAHLGDISLLPLAPLNRLPFPPSSVSCQGLIGNRFIFAGWSAGEQKGLSANSKAGSKPQFFFKCGIEAGCVWNSATSPKSQTLSCAAHALHGFAWDGWHRSTIGEANSHLDTCAFSTFCMCISSWIHQENVLPTIKQHFCIFTAPAAEPQPCQEFSTAALFPPSFTFLPCPCVFLSSPWLISLATGHSPTS